MTVSICFIIHPPPVFDNCFSNGNGNFPSSIKPLPRAADMHRSDLPRRPVRFFPGSTLRQGPVGKTRITVEETDRKTSVFIVFSDAPQDIPPHILRRAALPRRSAAHPPPGSVPPAVRRTAPLALDTRAMARSPSLHLPHQAPPGPAASYFGCGAMINSGAESHKHTDPCRAGFTNSSSQ